MDEGNEDVDTLLLWCSTVVDHFATLGSDPTIDELKIVVAEAGRTKNLQHLRSLKRDLTGWVRGLNPAQRQGVEGALRSARSSSLAVEDIHDREIVQRILERGAIETEDEYRLLASWTELMRGEPSREDEARRIDALLTRFGTQSS